jgi:hypothetical protein
MSTPTEEEIHDARAAGYDAVAASPIHAPRNPYEEDEAPGLYEAWDTGAEEAGINTRYHNGVLVTEVGGYPRKPSGRYFETE